MKRLVHFYQLHISSLFDHQHVQDQVNYSREEEPVERLSIQQDNLHQKAEVPALNLNTFPYIIAQQSSEHKSEKENSGNPAGEK